MKIKYYIITIIWLLIITCFIGEYNVCAQDSSILINKLVEKGILTKKESEKIQIEIKQKQIANNSKNSLIENYHPKIKIGGFLQMNASFGDVGSFEGNLERSIHSRFRIRRARINVSGDLFDDFNYKLEGDFQQGDGNTGGRTGFSASDLFINWHHFKEANIKLGQFKAPFGSEQLTSDTTMFTAERSLVTGALTPERQIGIEVWGYPLSSSSSWKNILSYNIGIFNGNGRNINVNNNANFMYAGRIIISPIHKQIFNKNLKWNFGLDGMTSTYGNNTRIGTTGNLLFNPLLNDGTLSSLTTSQENNNNSRAWGLDQSFTFGPFNLISEYLEEKVNLGNNNFIANGYYIQGAYTFNVDHHKTQIVSKYEKFNPGQRSHDNIESLTGGLNYYIKGDSIKLMLDYIHSWSDYRQYHPEIGPDQFNQILLRMQIMF